MAQLESLKVDFVVDNTLGIRAISEVIASMKELKKIGQTTLKVKASYKDVYKAQEAVEKVVDEVKDAKKEAGSFADKFKNSMKSAKNEANKSSLSIGKSLDMISYKISRIFKFLTFTYLGRQIVVLGDRLVKFGSDISEIENLFQVAMKDMADEAEKYAQKVSDSWGYSVYRIKEQIAYLHQMYTSMGIAEDTAYGMSKAVLELGYNLGSLYNLDPKDMIEKIKSGTLGVSRPLKQIGIVTNVAQLEMTALKHGIISTSREMTSQEKALATVWAVYEQGINAMESGEYVVDGVTHKMGDLSKTLMTNANLLRQLKDRLVQVVETFGLALQPVINTVLPYLVAFAKVLREIGEDFALWIGHFYGLSSLEEIIGKFGSTSKKQLEDVGDEADETAKKLKNLTGSIDELNILDTSDKGEGMQGGTIENDIGVPDIDSIFEGAMTPINDRAEQIKEVFKKAFSFDFFSGLKPSFDFLFTALKDVGRFFKDIFSLISNNKAFQEFGEKLKETVNTISAYILSASALFQQFWQNGGSEGFDNFITFISEMGTKILEFFDTKILPLFFNEELIEKIKGIAGAITSLVIAFAGFKAFPKVMEGFKAVKKVLTPVIDTFQALGWFMSQSSSKLEFLINLISGFLSTAGGIVTVVLAVIASLGYLYATNENVRETINDLIGTGKELIESVLKAIAPIVSTIGSVVSTIFQAILPIVQLFAETLLPVIKYVLWEIKLNLDMLKPVLELISWILNGVADILGTIFGWIGNIIDAVSELFKSGFGKVSGWVSGAWDKVTGWFKGDEKEDVPHFASGGIVYGDTIARVGEYSGANTNPEVIAPLSDLSSIIRQELANMVINMPDQPIEVTVVTELDGRELARSVNEVNSRKGFSYGGSGL